MTKAEELAAKYATIERSDGEGVIYITAYSAFIAGYKQAEKDLTLTWEDISIIRKVMYDYNKQVRNEMAIPKEEEYCKEVLKRFLEQKGGKV